MVGSRRWPSDETRRNRFPWSLGLGVLPVRRGARSAIAGCLPTLASVRSRARVALVTTSGTGARACHDHRARRDEARR